MNVVIDTTVYDAEPAGIGGYVRQLLKAYRERFPEDAVTVLSRSGIDWPGARVLPVLRRGAGAIERLAVEQLTLPRLLRRLPYDVAHFADYRCPLRTPARAIITIHDLAMFRYPETLTARQRWLKQTFTRASVRRAAHIIVPSASTKNDLVEWLGVPPAAITIVPHGVSSPEPQSLSVRAAHPRPYFLFVGTLEPRKNLVRVVQALRLLYDRVPDTDADLVVVGRPGWLYGEIFQEVERLHLGTRVLFLGYVSDEDRLAWYRGAIGFCFPTLYEGFGLPILEAMAAGCPVITANRGAAAEVAEGAALLVDPTDVDAICQALQQVLADMDLRERLQRSGMERAALYTWGRTAQETRDVYERVLAGG